MSVGAFALQATREVHEVVQGLRCGRERETLETSSSGENMIKIKYVLFFFLNPVCLYLSDLEVGLSIEVGGLDVAHGLRLAVEKCCSYIIFYHFTCVT